MANDLFRRNVEILDADGIERVRSEKGCKAVEYVVETVKVPSIHEGEIRARDHDLGDESSMKPGAEA